MLAIIEVQDGLRKREGTKSDGTKWGPFYTQTGYVHDGRSMYPRQIELNVRDGRGHPAGFYCVAGSAIYLNNGRLALGFANGEDLVPLQVALTDLQDFMRKNSVKAAAAA